MSTKTPKLDERKDAFMRALKYYRLLAGMRQRELASRMKVQKNTISAWETGRSFPRADLFPELANQLGVDKRVLVIAMTRGTFDADRTIAMA